MNILVTGSSGFVGRSLCERLKSDRSINLRISNRNKFDFIENTNCEVIIADLMRPEGWDKALSGIEVVIHAAARVHIMGVSDADSFDEYSSVNTIATLNLARNAAKANVRRFIFISTIKVNGEKTEYGSSFNSHDDPCPRDAYGISKFHAEIGLKKIADETGMEVVIIRPPLVYGPGVGGNFSALMNCIKMGIPLPLGAIKNNRRSLVGLDNLVDLITTCVKHPLASNKVFLVSDNQDLSTADLICKLGNALGRPARLVSVSPSTLILFAKIFGKYDMVTRLIDDLRVDISYTHQILGWVPPVSIEEGLKRLTK